VSASARAPVHCVLMFLIFEFFKILTVCSNDEFTPIVVRDNSLIQSCFASYDYVVLSLANPSTWDLPHEMTDSIMRHA
jgi:hypothetical protein